MPMIKFRESAYIYLYSSLKVFHAFELLPFGHTITLRCASIVKHVHDLMTQKQLDAD